MRLMPLTRTIRFMVVALWFTLDTQVQAVQTGRTELRVGESLITLHAGLDEYQIGRQAVLDWVMESARTVAAYYGRFPVPELDIVLDGYEGSGVRSGRAYGRPVLQVVIGIGHYVTREQLEDDWILAHELIHLALAELPDRHHWLEEGLPTYIESIARVQVGDLDETFIWRGFARGMPKGLPMGDDKGLDHTPTWGRTYWGGALFCLLADIEIRRRTGLRMGLQQAMQAVMEGGLTLDKNATIDDVIRLADGRTGTGVMRELYEKMKDKPGHVDMEVLWDQLGVGFDERGGVILDDAAPLAGIRIAITRPGAGRAVP